MSLPAPERGTWAVLATSAGRLDIHVPDGGDVIGDAVVGGRFVMPEMFDFALTLVEPGAAVLDLGAHLGTFSLLAAARGHHVVAVEASPRNAASLRASAAANRLSRLDVVEVAVDERPGVVRFVDDGAWGGVARGPGTSRELEVASLTVPQILDRAGRQDVALVKMDVEGSDLAAARSMQPLLAGARPPVVLYESNWHTLLAAGCTPRDLVQVFADCGYEQYRVDQYQGRGLVPLARDSFQASVLVDNLAARSLPELPRGWRRRRPDTRLDLVAAVVAETRQANWHHRAAIVRALRRAPSWLRHEPAVRTAVEALVLDPHWAVAAAARDDADELGVLPAADDPTALADLAAAFADRIECVKSRWSGH